MLYRTTFILLLLTAPAYSAFPSRGCWEMVRDAAISYFFNGQRVLKTDSIVRMASWYSRVYRRHWSGLPHLVAHLNRYPWKPRKWGEPFETQDMLSGEGITVLDVALKLESSLARGLRAKVILYDEDPHQHAAGAIVATWIRTVDEEEAKALAIEYHHPYIEIIASDYIGLFSLIRLIDEPFAQDDSFLNEEIRFLFNQMRYAKTQANGGLIRDTWDWGVLPGDYNAGVPRRLLKKMLFHFKTHNRRLQPSPSEE